MSDFGQEQSEGSKTEEQARRNQAESAQIQLLDDVGNLPESMIDNESSVFIGIHLLARELEISFLSSKEFENKIDPNDPYANSQKALNDRGKKRIDELNSIMVNVRVGNFKELKEFIGKLEESERSIGEDPGLVSGPELAEQYKRNAINLGLVKERMPMTGIPSNIRPPNPAWMEEPVPLKVQLVRFAAGGEIR